MKDKKQTPFQSLKGQLLIAMPNIDDLRFEKTVIYVYEHTEDFGAQGIVINRPADKMSFTDILDQLKIKYQQQALKQPSLVLGGPDQVTHGFILHSKDYKKPETARITSDVCLTATQDVLQDIAQGDGPLKSLVALGCASWIRGQLEDEIMSNVWLTTTAHNDILFDVPFSQRWNQALNSIGIQSAYLSSTSGKA